jgi:uridine kinase
LLKENFPSSKVVLIAQDRFYKPLTEEEKRNISNKNFDHPDSLDFEMIQNVLSELRFYLSTFF